MQLRRPDLFVSCWSSLLLRFARGLWLSCPRLAFLRSLIGRRWRLLRRIVSRTMFPSITMCFGNLVVVLLWLLPRRLSSVPHTARRWVECWW